jgi:hypothetical protein
MVWWIIHAVEKLLSFYIHVSSTEFFPKLLFREKCIISSKFYKSSAASAFLYRSYNSALELL